jgi:hypothetical protein
MKNSPKTNLLFNIYKKYLFSENHFKIPNTMTAILQKSVGGANTLYLGTTQTPVLFFLLDSKRK